ncbi:hypothetical protein ACFSZS_29660 [Seohaeicola zhoushanensis]
MLRTRSAPRGTLRPHSRGLQGRTPDRRRTCPGAVHAPLDPHQMSFAFTETLAHVNRLVRRGELKTVPRDGKLVTVPATDS